MRIIAANTSGKATPQDGYVIPGTGDKDGVCSLMLYSSLEVWLIKKKNNRLIGSIPEAFYSTKDPKSVKEFLNQCDVLVASLPNTPATQHFLNKEKLGSFFYAFTLLHFCDKTDRVIVFLEMLPKGAVLVNVGRGSLIPSGTSIPTRHLLPGLTKSSSLFSPHNNRRSHSCSQHPAPIRRRPRRDRPRTPTRSTPTVVPPEMHHHPAPVGKHRR